MLVGNPVFTFFELTNFQSESGLQETCCNQSKKNRKYVKRNTDNSTNH
ncbi:MAG: hypothetical protein LBL39_03235 [Planctomycetaceae bacterium]|nr:hypothetical protein [Planctomycetaceae bacterium]